MRIRVVCPYCDKDSKLVNGSFIYPGMRHLYSKSFYLCAPCKAWVGCHPKSINPLGRLANGPLRKLKQAAHAVFDPIWNNCTMSRKEAYKKLGDRMGISEANTHIGMFNEEQCELVIEICKGGL